MKFLSNLRSRIALIVFVAIVPLLLTVLAGYRAERAKAIADIDGDIRRTMAAVLLKENDVTDTIRLILGIMSRANDMKDPTPESCSGLAQRLMKAPLRFANLGAAWPDGRVFCSALEIRKAVKIDDRDWFKEIVASHKPGMGHYTTGRLSGQATVVYGYPQLNAQGELQTALFASVPLAWFAQVTEGIRIPDGWHAAVVTRDGLVAARSTVPAGHDHGRDEILQLLGTPPDQLVLRRVELAGNLHLVGIAPLPTVHGLYLLVGVDATSALGGIDARFLWQTGLIVAVAMLSALLAWWLIERDILSWTQRMTETVGRLARGDLSARAGQTGDIRELRLLATQFDTMAGQIESLTGNLEARVAERTAELARSNAELEAFVYSVSHDLRAPLRAISGFSEILAEHHAASLDAEGRRHLANVRQAAERMNQLIDDLLQLSRVGRSAIRREPVALGPLLRDIVTLATPRLAGGRIEIAEPLATPLGDARLVEQILANLIDNALKYHAPDQAPLVRVSATPVGDQVEIRVSDNGIGIAPEHFDRIFDVFQRLHTEEAYPGTGIGLAIVRKAARLMEAELRVESKPGAGSSFILRLPAAGTE